MPREICEACGQKYGSQRSLAHRISELETERDRYRKRVYDTPSAKPMVDFPDEGELTLVRMTARAERAEARIAELEKRLAKEEADHLGTLGQRDQCYEWADKFADAISARKGPIPSVSAALVVLVKSCPSSIPIPRKGNP